MVLRGGRAQDHRIPETRGHIFVDSAGAMLGAVPPIPAGLGQEPQGQSTQLRRRVVKADAAIDVLDLDDAAAAAPDGIDRLDPVTPVTDEAAFDDLRHASPFFLCGSGG